MERDELREQFLDAILSDGGQEALVVLVQQRIATGDSASVLVADLSELRPFLSEEKEDDVLDVMDRLVGWCGPSARLGE